MSITYFQGIGRERIFYPICGLPVNTVIGIFADTAFNFSFPIKNSYFFTWLPGLAPFDSLNGGTDDFTLQNINSLAGIGINYDVPQGCVLIGVGVPETKGADSHYSIPHIKADAIPARLTAGNGNDRDIYKFSSPLDAERYGFTFFIIYYPGQIIFTVYSLSVDLINKITYFYSFIPGRILFFTFFIHYGSKTDYHYPPRLQQHPDGMPSGHQAAGRQRLYRH